LWTYIMDKLGDLKSIVIDAIMGLLKTEIVEAGIKWILGLLTPAGAFVKACMAIIDIVKWFINNASRIADLISSIMDSIGDIASGNVGGAAKKVEMSLKRIIPITIGFLAGLLGIGDLSARVQGIIKKVTDPINKAIDWLLKKGYEYGKKFLDKILGKKDGPESSTVVQKEKDATIPAEHFEVDGHKHELFLNDKGELMVASSGPKRLKHALTNYTSNHSTEVSDAIEKGLKMQNEWKKIKDTKDEKTKEQLTKDAVAHELAIANILKVLHFGDEVDGKDKMDKITIEFSILYPAKKVEYLRQLKMQENAIKVMKVGDWQTQRMRFILFGRGKEDSDGSRAEALINKLVNSPDPGLLISEMDAILSPSLKGMLTKVLVTDKLILPTEEKRKRIEKSIINFIKNVSKPGMNVLHTIDQVVGGKATEYGDDMGIFGDAQVNSHIGAQWGPGGRAAKLDKAVMGVKNDALMDQLILDCK